VFRSLLAIVLLFVAVPAHAKKMVYSPVVHEGEKEFEYYLDWRENGAGSDVVGHEIAFEYGYAPKDMMALYLVYEDVSGSAVEFVKYKVEWVHQLFEQGERAWDVGTYLEYQVRDDPAKADKIEFKPLFEKDLSPFVVTINGVFEKEIGENATGGTELGYAARVAWRKHRRLVPALEAFGSLGEISDFTPADMQSHIVGPVVDVEISRFVRWQAGALFGVTDGSEDVRVKSNLAWEWY